MVLLLSWCMPVLNIPYFSFLLCRDSKSDGTWHNCPSYSTAVKNECYFDTNHTSIWLHYAIQLRSQTNDVYDEMFFTVEEIGRSREQIIFGSIWTKEGVCSHLVAAFKTQCLWNSLATVELTKLKNKQKKNCNASNNNITRVKIRSVYAWDLHWYRMQWPTLIVTVV